MSSQNLSPARLEAFSDGVIAVIITIMVLELKVPAHDGLAGLREVAPALLLYLLSFLQVGIYWVNHHYLLDEVETVGHGILWANLIFLFCLSLFPFATDWIGTRGLTPFSTAFYAAASLLPGITYSILWTQVRSQSVAPAHAAWGKQFLSIGMYLGAIPIAFWKPLISIAMIVFVAVMWLLPPNSEPTDEDQIRRSRAHPESPSASATFPPHKR